MKLVPIELAFMFLSNITYPFLHFAINFCFKNCFQQVLNFCMSRGQRYRYQRNPPVALFKVFWCRTQMNVKVFDFLRARISFPTKTKVVPPTLCSKFGILNYIKNIIFLSFFSEVIQIFCLFLVQNSIWGIFGCWDISKMVLSKLKKNRFSVFWKLFQNFIPNI